MTQPTPFDAPDGGAAPGRLAWEIDDDSDFGGGDLGRGMDADQDASYSCWACGEEIVIPIDLTMGTRQDYVEDCPVCCRPNEIHVEIDAEGGHVRCWNDAVG